MKTRDDVLLEQAYQRVLKERDVLAAASVKARQIHLFLTHAGQDKANAQKSLEPKLPLTPEEKIKPLQDLANKTGGVIVGGVYMGDVAMEHGYITPEEKQMFDAVAMPREDEE